MDKDRRITCHFTGHRSIPPEDLPAVRDRLRRAIYQLYLEGYRHFVAGGALGFDTLAAAEVLAMKAHLPDLSLSLVLPCADQDARWSLAERRAYALQKEAADEVIILAERYYEGCMQARNQAMVDMSSACIAYLTHPRSGAGQTVRLAQKAGLRLFNAAPKK